MLRSRSDTWPIGVELSWPQFVSRFELPRRLQFSAAQYAALPKKEQGEAKDGAAWIPGELGEAGGRVDANVKQLCALVFDFDALFVADTARLWETFRHYKYLAHTSASHTEDKPKWRVVLPLSEPVPGDRWKPFWLGAVRYFGLRGRIAADAAAKNPSRLYYLPSSLYDVEPRLRVLEGRTLDVSAVDVRPPPVRPAPTLTWETSDKALTHHARVLQRMGPAVEGAMGDQHTFRAACYLVRDAGLSVSEALPLFREWNQTNSPPWPEEHLETKLLGALKYGKNPIGNRRYAGNKMTFDTNAVRALFEEK